MIYRFLDIEFDCAAGEIRRGGRVIRAEKKPVQLLRFLIEARGRVVERQEILDSVWEGVSVTPHVLSQAMHVLRHTLEDDPNHPHVIKTIRGRGFRFLPAFVQRRKAGMSNCGEFSFVGRSPEMALLERALDDARFGTGRIVIVSGEAGIGKTRLLQEVLWRAKENDVPSYVGACSETGGIPPFWPWTEILEKRRSSLGPQQWMAETNDWPIASRMLAGEGLSDPENGTVSARLASLARFARYFVSISVASPVVLGFEDAHWADDASIELIRTLSNSISESRILLVITMRGLGDDGRSRLPFPRRILHRSHTTSIELGPLSNRDVEELLRDAEIRDSEEVARDLTRKSGGNAFFLTSLVQSLSVRRGSKSCTSELPNSIRESVHQQFEELPQASKSVVSVASVLGESFNGAILAQAMGVSEEKVLDWLDIPIRRGLVRERASGRLRYEFVHSLVAECLYDELPRGERALWHARVAKAFEARASLDGQTASIAALARHYTEGGAEGSLEKALWYVASAGVDARRSLAYQDASRFLERAVGLARDLGKDNEVLLDLLLLLGDSQARNGDRKTAENTFVEAAGVAKVSGRGDRLSKVALSVAPGLLLLELGVVDPFVVGLLEGSLENLNSDDCLRAKVMARLAVALHWVPDTATRRSKLIARAHDLVGKTGGSDTFVKAHAVAALWSPSNFKERIDQVHEIRLSESGLELDEVQLIGRIFSISHALERGDLACYEDEVASLEVASKRSPSSSQVAWYVTMYRSSLALSRGELSTAESLATSFFKMGMALGDVNAAHSFGAILETIRWHQSRVGETLSQLKPLAERFPRVPAWRAAYSLGLIDTGDQDRAREEYCLARDSAMGRERNVLWLISIALLSEVAVRLGAKEDASRFLEVLLPFSNRLVAAGYGVCTWGSVARVAGMLAAECDYFDHACKLLERANAVEQRTGLWAWLPYSQVELATAYLRRGRSADAPKSVALAYAAMRSATKLGLVKVSDRAEKIWRDAKVHSV